MKFLTPLLVGLVLQSVLLPFEACAKNTKVDGPAQAIAAANENRIIRYPYSSEIIFRVLTLPSLHTHIELGEDEGIKEVPMVGDSAQWRVSGGPRNIYVKPLRENISTSLTLVTNVRTYQLQLISGSTKDSQVYQKISFDYPERDLELKLRVDQDKAVVKVEDDRLQQQVIATGVDPSSLNFSYDIKGDASFKPLAVYSDGRFTFIRMPNTQDMPAIFLVDELEQPSLINFKVKENLIGYSGPS